MASDDQTQTKIAAKIAAYNMSSLAEVARDILAKGPHKLETTPRRVRALYDGTWIFDTTAPRHVWEFPWYPHYYIPTDEVKAGSLTKNDAVDKEGSAFLATLKGKSKSTDRVLIFEKGPLAGLVRFEFKALDAWFEEDQPIYGHPKDPYKRVEILPSSRKVTIKIDGVAVAESGNNMFLFETGLRARFYMPKPSVDWQYFTDSDTVTMCPYKGEAKYYSANVNGKEYKDILWWYKYPTAESALIAGHACFYNEKVDVYIDGVKEEK